MSKEYLNQADVRMKFNRTIVFYKGLPYWIDMDRRGTDLTGLKWDEIYAEPLIKTKKGMIVIKHQEAETEFKLGYLNWNNSAYYLSRLPERVQTAGLKGSTITFMSRAPSGPWFTSQNMGDLLLGNYPTLTLAIDMLNSLEYDTVAFHRRFAVGWIDEQKMGLYYQGRLVGNRHPLTGTFEVLPSQEASFIRNIMVKTGVFDGNAAAA